MNKQRILSIGGVAFFSTLIGIGGVDWLIKLDVDPLYFLLGALFSAGVQAGLAICQELKVETELTTSRDTKGYGTFKKDKCVRNMLFLI